MKAATRRKSGRNGFDLIEEATQLLRTAPLTTLAGYYLGAIPFVLGLLYFWVDMSRNPFASQHLAEAGLGVTVLFLWMKFCQALFARRLRAQLAAAPMPAWNFRQCLRVFLSQAIVQPFGLFLIPLSLIPVLPFAWTYAFFQNITALADPEARETSKLLNPSWKQASLWPAQNHLVLGILVVFGFCIFLNWLTVCLAIPSLIKMLFGIESIFTQSPFAMFNTTFLTALLGLTYLSVDPILKAIYVLRCFYGQSLQSGEDLKADLKRFSSSPLQTAALVVLLALMGANSLSAQDANPTTAPAAPTEVSPIIPTDKLDRTIDEVIHERKYTWRMPREKSVEADSDKGMFTRFFEKVGRMVRSFLRFVVESIGTLIEKLFNRKGSGSGSGFGTGWVTSLQIVLFALVAIALSILAVILIRVWRNRQRTAMPVATEAIQPVPDLADEDVAADQLPEDGWTKLGRELLERGEFRLAMRAFYLASLAHLAGRNLIHITRFKSNRDYENELRRRGHAIPELLPVFGENLSVFERIWYGLHEVDRERVQQFAVNVDKLKAVA